MSKNTKMFETVFGNKNVQFYFSKFYYEVSIKMKYQK